jgi:ssDNA-binding Zn-finger/Zn-ribbon topoisomerase 1
MTLAAIQKEELIHTPLIILMRCLARLAARPTLMARTIQNEREYRALYPMMQYVSKLCEPQPISDRPVCKCCTPKMNLRKDAMNKMYWQCALYPHCGYQRAWNPNLDDPKSGLNVLKAKEKCPHADEDGAKTIKEYVAGRHGRFARCNQCQRRWKQDKETLEWALYDDPAKSSGSSLPWPPPSGPNTAKSSSKSSSSQQVPNPATPKAKATAARQASLERKRPTSSQGTRAPGPAGQAMQVEKFDLDDSDDETSQYDWEKVEPAASSPLAE